jgi:glycosyltransferase 2 family protein
VVGLTAVAATDGVPAWEEAVFDAVYQLPSWLMPVLWAPMQLGSALAPPVVAAWSWLAWHRWRPSVGAVVAGLGGWWLAKGIKTVVERGRPGAIIEGLDLRSGTPTDGLGFLSGHTTVAFALATVLSPYLTRQQRVVAYTLAGVVAFARVHVGAHLPLDVIAGAALGSLLGWTWHLIVGIPESLLAARPLDLRAGERPRAD